MPEVTVKDGAFCFPATWAITINRSFAIQFRRRHAITCSLNRLTAIVCTIRKIRKWRWRASSTMPRNAAPVLIPAFAVGRTQEIVYLIRELEDEKAIPVLPVTVDSPMAAANNCLRESQRRA